MGRQNLAVSQENRDSGGNPLVPLLINLYQLQLARGCGSPDCNTPTCYTFRKRNNPKPLRRLLPLSVRATAYFLADSDNPESQLCPFVAQYILDPVAKSKINADVPLDHLIWSTNLLASSSSKGKSSSTTTRQDPCSFAQRLFNSGPARRGTDGSDDLFEEAGPHSPSRYPITLLDKHHAALSEVGDLLQASFLRFDQHGNTRLVARAVSAAINALTAFNESILWDPIRDAVHPVKLIQETQDLQHNPDPIALRVANLLTKNLALLINSCPGNLTSSNAILSHVFQTKTPACAEEHLFSLLLHAIIQTFAKLGRRSLLGFRWWLQTIFVNSWDKTPIIDRNSSAGAALMLADIVRGVGFIANMDIDFFRVVINNPYRAALRWGKIPLTDKSSLCLLEYPWMLVASSQIKCFRAICLDRMCDAVDDSSLNLRILSSSTSGLFYPQQRRDEAQRPPPEILSLQFGQLQIATTRHLTLQVDRDNIISDAFYGLWRRQERELFRPLKVKMTNVGELGVDQGGIAQEFFRLVFIEVFDPAFGIFTVEERTHMTWFDPKSLEPVYKLEMLGTLMALAIFNGFTLPVNFPLALYRKLCNLPVDRLEFIEDGWPDLVKGLKQLLNWKDGDVADTFCRSYVFTFEAFNRMIHVDMTKTNEAWSPIAAISNNHNGEENAPLVTNATRTHFVDDYILWLTEKSIAPQYEAFARGFHRIIDVTILRTIEPSVLRRVVEGERNIDTKELQRVAKYDAGYCAHRSYVRDFWEIVHSFDDIKKKQLLEFVTASDRIPVTGMDTVEFVIQRHGGDTESLPTSVTCFGRLLLPQYENKAKLKQKLELALENSKGFGLS